MTPEERARLIEAVNKHKCLSMEIGIIQCEEIIADLRRVDVLEKALRQFVDGYQGKPIVHSRGEYLDGKKALGDA